MLDVALEARPPTVMMAGANPAAVERILRRRDPRITMEISLDDLRGLPGNRLEVLKGDRKGQLSIRINDQRRLCFRWHEGDAYDVEIVDCPEGRRP